MPKFDRDCTVNHAACRATIRVSAVVDPSAGAGGAAPERVGGLSYTFVDPDNARRFDTAAQRAATLERLPRG